MRYNPGKDVIVFKGVEYRIRYTLLDVDDFVADIYVPGDGVYDVTDLVC